jgi:hypothetical protein
MECALTLYGKFCSICNRREVKDQEAKNIDTRGHVPKSPVKGRERETQVGGETV